MAGVSKRAQAGTPDQVPASLPTANLYSHDFSLQAIMEMQKSIGQMQSSIEGLKQAMLANADSTSKALDSLKRTSDETREKVFKFEKILYASIAVGTIAVVVGGWMINTAKEMGMVYYKASVEAQLKQQSPDALQKAPSAKK